MEGLSRTLRVRIDKNAMYSLDLFNTILRLLKILCLDVYEDIRIVKSPGQVLKGLHIRQHSNEKLMIPLDSVKFRNALIHIQNLYGDFKSYSSLVARGNSLTAYNTVHGQFKLVAHSRWGAKGAHINPISHY